MFKCSDSSMNLLFEFQIANCPNLCKKKLQTKAEKLLFAMNTIISRISLYVQTIRISSIANWSDKSTLVSSEPTKLDIQMFRN